MILPSPKDFASAGQDIDYALGLSELDQLLRDASERRNRLMRRSPDRAPSPELRAAQAAVDVLAEARERLILVARDLIPAQAGRIAQQRADEIEEAA